MNNRCYQCSSEVFQAVRRHTNPQSTIQAHKSDSPRMHPADFMRRILESHQRSGHDGKDTLILFTFRFLILILFTPTLDRRRGPYGNCAVRATTGWAFCCRRKLSQVWELKRVTAHCEHRCKQSMVTFIYIAYECMCLSNYSLIRLFINLSVSAPSTYVFCCSF